jgi:hypothetical protein
MTTTIVITSGSSFNLPADWPGKGTCYLIGGGGGPGAASSSNAGPGGGGAGFQELTPFTGGTAGQLVYCQIGQGGGTGVAGTNTWFNISTNAQPTSGGQGGWAPGGSAGSGSTGGAGGTGGLGNAGVNGGGRQCHDHRRRRRWWWCW